VDAGLKPHVQLEIACSSLASALAAQSGGADRLELCGDLANGGTTPSWGTLRQVRQRVQLPLFVLVRPRSGDFVYSEDETQVMLDDVACCRQLGCDGIVIGALTADGAVDTALCGRLIDAAGALEVTFHRAFDLVMDRRAALEAVVALGCQRILSSGGQADAQTGSAVLAADIAVAAGRIAIMAGAGVHAGNVAELVRRTGCRQVHASASRLHCPSSGGKPAPALPGLAPAYRQTDAQAVAALRQALVAIEGHVGV